MTKEKQLESTPFNQDSGDQSHSRTRSPRKRGQAEDEDDSGTVDRSKRSKNISTAWFVPYQGSPYHSMADNFKRPVQEEENQVFVDCHEL
jgi:hypothetical protein